MKVKFTKEIGTRYSFRSYWGNDCPHWGYHNALKHIKDVLEVAKWDAYSKEVKDYPIESFPSVCDHCGAIASTDKNIQIFSERLYNTASGRLEPGNLFWNTWLPENMYWDNHKGPHLCAVLPNGHEWNIDSRASNCTMPSDKLHRCWVRHGNPELGDIHVDKIGLTCQAGGGSIVGGNYHGLLHNGSFTPSI